MAPWSWGETSARAGGWVLPRPPDQGDRGEAAQHPRQPWWRSPGSASIGCEPSEKDLINQSQPFQHPLKVSIAEHQVYVCVCACARVIQRSIDLEQRKPQHHMFSSGASNSGQNKPMTTCNTAACRKHDLKNYMLNSRTNCNLW